MNIPSNIEVDKSAYFFYCDGCKKDFEDAPMVIFKSVCTQACPDCVRRYCRQCASALFVRVMRELEG